jgi:hypothetical protein
MTEPLHPEYEKFLLDCYGKVQKKLGTGEIKKEEELQQYVFSLCEFPSATDAFSFVSQYASYSWQSIVNIGLLQNLDGDLVEFIIQTVNITLALEVFLNVKINSDGYRFLIEGALTEAVTLQPDATSVKFTECWRKEADQFKDCQVIESVVEDDGYLTIYQLPDNFEWVYVMNHLDDSLVWIGKQVEK